MAGDSLSGFKGAVIFQKIRDAGFLCANFKGWSVSNISNSLNPNKGSDQIGVKISFKDRHQRRNGSSNPLCRYVSPAPPV